jgi:hypothetical protein
MAKFEKTMYVAEWGDAAEEGLRPGKTIQEVVEDDGPTEVGVYELVRVVRVRKIVQFDIIEEN